MYTIITNFSSIVIVTPRTNLHVTSKIPCMFISKPPCSLLPYSALIQQSFIMVIEIKIAIIKTANH